MTNGRKVELERRYMKELVEFLSPNLQVRDDNNEKQGRITGSEQWKKERGEAGSCVVCHTPTIISPNGDEIACKFLRFVYLFCLIKWQNCFNCFF